MTRITTAGMPARVNSDAMVRRCGQRACETLYDRTIRLGLSEMREVSSLREALAYFRSGAEEAGSALRFYSPADEVFFHLRLSEVRDLPFEFSITRLKDSSEWVARKGTGKDVLFWASRRHDHIGSFDFVLHSHDEDRAMPSATDLKTMVYTRNLGVTHALRGRAGLTFYRALPGLDVRGFSAFIKEDSLQYLGRPGGVQSLADKMLLAERLSAFGWIDTEFIPFSDRQRAFAAMGADRG